MRARVDRAIAITGMGMVTAQGVGVEASWRGVVEGRKVLRPWKRGDGVEAGMEGGPLARIRVAQCGDDGGELPRPEDLPVWLWTSLSRTQQLAALAVGEALAAAGLPFRLGDEGIPAGVFLATTVCGMDQTERFYAQYRVARDAADTRLMRRMMPYEVGTFIARRHRVTVEAGLQQVCLTTCVGSAMAIANAVDAISQGECEVAIAGGAEAICRVVLSGFNALKVAAAEGCRPFDEDRPGMTVGEGSGVLILESAEHVRRRGGQVHAWIRGVGLTCDAHHLTAPERSGVQAVRAMREALTRAGMTAGEIGYVNAHGTGTKDNDAMEARALREVFGENGVAVSSTKRCTGHTFGAAGAVEAIFCVRALQEGVLPGNAGSVNGDEGMGVRVLRGGSVREEVGAVMSTNFAFGGNNAAMVIAREEGVGSAGDGAAGGGEVLCRACPGAPAPAQGTRGEECTGAEGLVVEGVGIVTDAYGSVRELAVDADDEHKPVLQTAEVLDPAVVAGQDVLAQLVIRAGHQAWTMAGLGDVAPERIGLLFVSEWGTIDATVAYLETMLEAGGRYASPRHFTRSVYSSVASVTAIHFGIRGACETLVFPSPAEDPVRGALVQARRMLRARRADRVMIVWAEQAAEIAQDLCRRAVRELGRKDVERYGEELGFGAVAVVVGLGEGEVRINGGRGKGRPFVMERAVGVVMGFLRS
jgi:3-oxoacyl-[acyl-carrier-protein] synthase II